MTAFEESHFLEFLMTDREGGLPPSGSGEGQRVFDRPPTKKIQKFGLFKNSCTLTTIQPQEKTQLTKVVSPLKGFGDPMQTL